MFRKSFYYKVDSVKSCLEKSGLDVNHGLQVIADKSLISIDFTRCIRMHSLLQKMGREIVKKKSLEEPGKRQFLWDNKEISDVFEENTGTGTVLGIFFKTSKGEEIQISKSAFYGMNNLQFLTVNSDNLCIPEGLDCLPHKLRLINWDDCPLRIWPSKFSGKFLVELIMTKDKFEKLWEEIKPLQCLKLMDLSESQYLKEIPDLSKATRLEKLDLSGCKSLLEITSSIGNAIKLRVCKLNGCELLKELPSSIGRLINLEELDICKCWRIKDFPHVSDSIVELKLNETKIEEIPPWIEKLFRLRTLVMLGCEKLGKVSRNISKLENLEYLGLSELDLRYPEDFEYGSDLYEAIIEWGPDFKRRWILRSDFDVHYMFPLCLPEKALTSPISIRFESGGLYSIPYCIERLSRLSKLTVTECARLDSLPSLPGSVLSIDGCRSLKTIESSFQNPNICLNFADCSKLNQEARKLIETSACKYAFLPGEKVPAHFTHQSTLRSLTINLTPRPLLSSLRFKACILLSYNDGYDNPSYNDGYDDEDGDNSLRGISYRVRGDQNGHTVQYVSDLLHVPDVYRNPKHLYIFEDSFSLNQDCLEAGETSINELSFVFLVHGSTFKVKGCGLRLLEEVPCCIQDEEANKKNAGGEDEEKEQDDYNDDNNADDGDGDGHGDEDETDDDGEGFIRILLEVPS